MTSTEKNILVLAAELSAAFETRERNNRQSFVCLKDDAPEWMRDVVHETHGASMPDDFIYQFCQMAADALSEVEESDEDSMREAIDAIEPPVYTYEQMRWFAGNYEYCDQAIEEDQWESYTFQNNRRIYHQITELITIGMALHIREVGNTLLNALIVRANSL